MKRYQVLLLAATALLLALNWFHPLLFGWNLPRVSVQSWLAAEAHRTEFTAKQTLLYSKKFHSRYQVLRIRFGDVKGFTLVGKKLDKDQSGTETFVTQRQKGRLEEVYTIWRESIENVEWKRAD